MLTLLLILLALLGGVTLSVQSSVNGRLGGTVGVLAAAWLTFVLGALISVLLVFFAQPPQDMTLLDAPRWQLTGAFFGVFYIVAMVFSVPRVGIAAATVAVITGQLAMSVLIDNFAWLGNARIPLDPERWGAIVLLFAAMGLIYLGNRRRERV
ncbi:DMT family transporter [Salipiger sp. PrR003]|uniref:DMT family transporter n=1 Tax=Salipiger sp. PrR003 TaxID=2706776 RepID=UPI0013D964B2|nr:DMT family transporter [Salipiger sp. PrR003]NDV53011.1 DMT family transporter [Salipiger sp. PrR003]